MTIPKKAWPLLVAVVLGLTPAIDIGWNLAQNRMPVPWWWSTRVFGWPGFFVLGQLLGDWWIPTNITHMSLARHLLRWSIFILVNTGLWVLAVSGLQRYLRSAHRDRGAAT